MKFDIHHLFKALSDPSRMQIFHSLMVLTTALSISQISTQFNMSRQGVTKHIKQLESAGLIQIDKDGRERFCKANPDALKAFHQWLSFYDQFWDRSLGNLSDYLSKKQ